MNSPEDELLLSVALQNANSILVARQRAEEELLRAKTALEAKTDELAHSLSMMRATLESTTDGILATDRNGKITAFNEAFVRIIGIAPEMMDSADHRAVQDAISHRLKDESVYLAQIESIYEQSPRATFNVLDFKEGKIVERFSSIQTLDGRNVGRVWCFRDVTERRRSEDALRDETRMLELLNRTGAILSSQLSLEVLVQTITDAATQLSGAKFGALFYKTTNDRGDAFVLSTLNGAAREAFEQSGQPRSTPVFEPALSGERIVRYDDVTSEERYGEIASHFGMPKEHLPVRSYLEVPVTSRSGEVIGGLFLGHPEAGIFSERTEHLIAGVAAQSAVAIDNARLFESAQRASEERKHLLESERSAREMAERASKLKDDFLAILSHELRTPLNAIVGWSQMLKHGLSDPAKVQSAIDSIERNAKTQTQLIEDLLDMSRITSGKMRLDMQPVAPISIIEAGIETMTPAAEAKGIRLQTFLDPTAGPISGDPGRLQQVVWNLLSNAIKFTPKGGKVQVLLQRVNSHIEICVCDTGIGILPDFLPYVFDRFRQGDSSATRNYPGLGLGLAIVKSLVELHGGSVRVDSAGKDQGSTFTIQLPLTIFRKAVDAERLHPTASSASIPFEQSDLTGLKVLVIDDELDARVLLHHVFGVCGATVLEAGDATEALNLVEKERPHILVCDIGMPNVDGYELIRRVRALGESRGGRVSAIALTAFARPEDRTRALRAGFLVHVAKPVDPSEIVAVVASIAGRTITPPL